MGRKGRRIRLHGYNIEPFEVECALMRRPGVTGAVVVLHEVTQAKPVWWATWSRIRMLHILCEKD